MFAKTAAAFVVTAAMTVGGLGVTFAASAGASTTPPAPTTSNKPNTNNHCALAQLRVNAIAARKTAVADRLTLLEAALSNAQAKNRSARVQKLETAITKAEANQDKLSTRLTTIEQACDVMPA